MPSVARRPVWIDAQLPPSLARRLRSEFDVDAVHVYELGAHTATYAAILAIAATACARPAVPPSMDDPLGSVIAPTASARATAAPASITPIATIAVPSDPDDPAVGPVLEYGPWSPDGRWLPVWSGTNWNVGGFGDATLGFVEARTGAVCVQPGIVRASRADAVFWSDDGRAHVRIDGRVSAGAPCDELVPQPSSPHSLPTAAPGATPFWAEHPVPEGVDAPGPEDSAPSPDGLYIATTAAALDYITRITRAADGVIIAEARWQGGDRLGDMGLGGTWLPSGDLVIHRSDDLGPLLLRPSGEVVSVAEHMFGLDLGTLDVGQLHAVPAIREGEPWHLLLTGAGNVRLYHSETRDTENLPSDDLWSLSSTSPAERGLGISGDGRWLMLHGHHGAQGSPGGLWVRPVEDRSATLRLIPDSVEDDASWAPTSPDGRRVAFVDAQDGLLSVVGFPAGDVVGRWHLAGYEAGYADWSPDGRSIAIDGYVYGADDSAPVACGLFLISLPHDGAQGPDLLTVEDPTPSGP